MKIIYCCLILLLYTGCTNYPSLTEASFKDGRFEIQQSDLSEGTPIFFKITEGNEMAHISFFVIKFNGNISSYFNACSKCYTSKKGFRVEKNQLICRICEVGYPFSSLDSGIASCFPIRLKGEMINDKYIIEKNEILKGRDYF
ncbi:MAG: DUF2318 domain-containing protein [Nitrospirae bacterium]|nr:DUF2318 domain-containing protein [Nitrospirota bacterium]MBF0539881.1 DUF2318 domain-containing protein [Nitrospirota bacterium]